MPYGIKDVAEKLNLSVPTIRYYDKEGLLPFIERKESGYRVFNEGDVQLLKIIECMKKTGMQLKDIKKFVDYVTEGDSSLQKRYELFEERRKAVTEQMAELQKSLDLIEYKCWYYKTAVEAGTEKVHQTNCFDVKSPLDE